MHETTEPRRDWPRDFLAEIAEVGDREVTAGQAKALLAEIDRLREALAIADAACRTYWGWEYGGDGDNDTPDTRLLVRWSEDFNARGGALQGRAEMAEGTSQPTDIVARLRDVAPGYGAMRLEAAAEIERLRAALREIAAGSYPLPLNEDTATWRRLAGKRKDIAQMALQRTSQPTDAALLDWLEQHPQCEVSHGGWDDPPLWRVHRVAGGRNDREWTLLGEGETAREAILAAMTNPTP